MLLLIFIYSTILYGQHTCILTDISLPDELKNGDLQISGLYAHSGKIYLLGEHDKDPNDASQNIFSIDSIEIAKKMVDANYIIQHQTLKIKNLDWAIKKITLHNESFDGLEAMVISNDTFYFSLETNWKNSQYCYLIRGRLSANIIELDTNYLLTLKRPQDHIIKQVNNAGFEALAMVDNNLYAFFEFNNFKDSASNNVLKINTQNNEMASLKINKPIPFRITDITRENDSTFYAINFFYNGKAESIYRENLTSKEEDLIKVPGAPDAYKNFARIIKLELKGDTFSWEPMGNFPENIKNDDFNYTSWNWEGMAKFQHGFLVVNDKYRDKASQSTHVMFCDCSLRTTNSLNDLQPQKSSLQKSP